MEPSNNSNQSSQDWFNNIDPPVKLSPLKYTAPKNSNRLLKIIIAVAVGLLVIAGVVGLAFLNVTQKPVADSAPCLTNSSYEEFVGVKSETDIPTKDNFYTQSIGFENGTTNYAKDSAAETEEFLQKIGKFYTKYSSSASIVISISSDYIKGGTSDIANQRLKKLTDALTSNGVSDSAIVVGEPKPITVEEDYVVTDAPTLISITSASTCQE